MIIEIPDYLKNEFVGFIELALCNLESNAMTNDRSKLFTKDEEMLMKILNQFVKDNS